MCEENQTQVTEFLLLGFQGLHNLKVLFFTLFLLIYVVILGGNLLIILLVMTMDHLNTPMFYFLKHLALADMLHTTNIVPLMLAVILMEGRTISLDGCLLQLYIYGVSSTVQCFLLAVMSFDRYLAIYKPLNYAIIMGPKVCLQLVSGCWLIIFILISGEMITIYQFEFCGGHNIDHFFCDLTPLVELTTSDTSTLMLQELCLSYMMISSFGFIMITYILIFFTIMKMPSIHGRRKFFSTCSAHLITVCTCYVTMIVVYMVPPGEDSVTVNKFRSLLYIVATPFMNPIIYSLRNQEIRGALKKILKGPLNCF
ncbi:olfactory receptor 5P50-like [Pelodytes ibericus]